MTEDPMASVRGSNVSDERLSNVPLPSAEEVRVTEGTTEDPIGSVWGWLVATVRVRKASDASLSDSRAGVDVWMRVSNAMERIHVFDGLKLRDLLARTLTKRAAEELDGEMPDVDWAFEEFGQRFRANAGFDRHGLTVSLRPLPTDPPSPESLGLDPKWLEYLSRQERGLVLLTGQTGSGKTSTLAAVLQWMNQRFPRKIVTLEDPIEYTLTPEQCEIHQREVGTHTRNFALGLRAALRQNPDIVLVGEMRDPETIGIALRAAETGHLVVGTMHCGTVVEVPSRIFNEFPAERERAIRTSLGECLRMVIAQKLLPRREGGRIAWREVLVGSDTVRAIVQNGNILELVNHMHAGGKEGMMTFEQSLQKIKSVITDEAWNANKPRQRE